MAYTLCEFRNMIDDKLYYLANSQGDLATCSTIPPDDLPSAAMGQCQFPTTNQKTKIPCKTQYDVDAGVPLGWQANAVPLASDVLVGLDTSQYQFALSRMSDNTRIQQIMDNYFTNNLEMTSLLNESIQEPIARPESNSPSAFAPADAPKAQIIPAVLSTPSALDIERANLSANLTYSTIPNFAPTPIAAPKVAVSMSSMERFRRMLFAAALLVIIAIIICSVNQVMA